MPARYTAIMVEPRKHRALEHVIRNFHDNLASDWVIKIIVGDQNYRYAKAICEAVHPRVKCINARIPNLTTAAYSRLLLNPRFYDLIDTEMFLVFQTDSMINPVCRDYIYQFMEYDYVGAPWAEKRFSQTGGVGNGGLSLRRKSKMLQVLKNQPGLRDSHINEDVLFSRYNGNILKIPSWQKARSFSVETVFSEKSFGLHKPWRHLPPSHINYLAEKVPGLKTLMALQ